MFVFLNIKISVNYITKRKIIVVLINHPIHLKITNPRSSKVEKGWNPWISEFYTTAEVPQEIPPWEEGERERNSIKKQYFRYHTSI